MLLSAYKIFKYFINNSIFFVQTNEQKKDPFLFAINFYFDQLLTYYIIIFRPANSKINKYSHFSFQMANLASFDLNI